MIKPIKNRILLKIKKIEDKTKSGIIISNSTKEKSKTAEIIEIGEGIGKEYEILKKGQIVLYNKYSAIEILYEEEEYLIIEASEILAIIEWFFVVGVDVHGDPIKINQTRKEW